MFIVIFYFRIAPESDDEDTEMLIDDEYEVLATLQDAQINEETTGATDAQNTAPQIATEKKKARKRLRKNEVKWIEGSKFEAVKTSFRPQACSTPTNCDVPFKFFKLYFPQSFFELLAEKTNQYALQKNIALSVTVSDIENFIALHILMGVYKFPRIRMYWEKSCNITIFSETMSRDKFFRMRTCLHAVDNLSKPEGTTDAFWKVRPFFETVRRRCTELVVEENVAVDEQMVPFTGQHRAKQYIRGKPCPWGFKLFVMCGKSGIVYDFIVYQGSGTELDKEDQAVYGYGGAVVLKLTERLTNHHSIFFDNYFTTYNLLLELQERGLNATGTVRLNRFQAPPLKSEKALTKQGRGAHDEVVSKDAIVLVRWVDNKSVHLASNCIGVGKTHLVKRWSKKDKSYSHIECPEIVASYNNNMGGVDLFDQMVATYRTFLRSRKWTLRIMSHMIDFAVVNSWREWREACVRSNDKSNQDLMAFRLRVANGLLLCGKPVASGSGKKGRPRTTMAANDGEPPKAKRKMELQPSKELRFDNVDHLPQMDDRGNGHQTRCKLAGCKGKTNFYCQKCKVHLCITKLNMCFTKFHS